MLVVRLSGTGELGSVAKSIENRIAWQVVSGSKQIIAVGGPSDWHAPGPLPPDAIEVDLIKASMTDPVVAKELWSPFLAYVDAKENTGFLNELKRYFVAIPVRVEIADAKLHHAVVAAIRGSKRFRIKLHDG